MRACNFIVEKTPSIQSPRGNEHNFGLFWCEANQPTLTRPTVQRVGGFLSGTWHRISKSAFRDLKVDFHNIMSIHWSAIREEKHMGTNASTSKARDYKLTDFDVKRVARKSCS
jgi:hypothetical protein